MSEHKHHGAGASPASDEARLEKEIQAKGLSAPRITPEHIDSLIVSEVSGRASLLFKDCPGAEKLSTLTICVVTLKNGTALVGTSACASPENYDPDIGHKLARNNAREKIWALEGYLLRERLHEAAK